MHFVSNLFLNLHWHRIQIIKSNVGKLIVDSYQIREVKSKQIDSYKLKYENHILLQNDQIELIGQFGYSNQTTLSYQDHNSNQINLVFELIKHPP